MPSPMPVSAPVMRNYGNCSARTLRSFPFGRRSRGLTTRSSPALMVRKPTPLFPARIATCALPMWFNQPWR